MDWLEKKGGPVLFGIVVVVSIWFIYWFAAVYH
jgi:hypothetical protein